LNSITQFKFLDPFSILPLIERHLADWNGVLLMPKAIV